VTIAAETDRQFLEQTACICVFGAGASHEEDVELAMEFLRRMPALIAQHKRRPFNVVRAELRERLSKGPR
jgi:hypothetical protein